jgi:hypothetical protein
MTRQPEALFLILAGGHLVSDRTFGDFDLVLEAPRQGVAG